MTAHVCPKCDGLKKFESKPCPTCNETGVVWKENSPKAGDSFKKG